MSDSKTARAIRVAIEVAKRNGYDDVVSRLVAILRKLDDQSCHDEAAGY